MAHEKTALITGGSKGIGYHIARQFAAHGYRTILVARSNEQLQIAAKNIERDFSTTVHTISADLRETRGIQSIARFIHSKEIPLAHLINNAGFGLYGRFDSLSLPSQLDLMKVNMEALVALTHTCLPDLKKYGPSSILNVASMAAFEPGPLMSVYYASKAFVVSFSLALKQELAKESISVSALCPGPTESDFQRKGGINNSRLNRWGVLQTLTPEFVAQAAYNGLMRKKQIIIPGYRSKLAYFAVKLAPVSIVTKVLYFLNKQRA